MGDSKGVCVYVFPYNGLEVSGPNNVFTRSVVTENRGRSEDRDSYSL